MQKFKDMDVKDQIDTVVFYIKEIVGGIVFSALMGVLVILCSVA